jgi:hypothetical protein
VDDDLKLMVDLALLAASGVGLSLLLYLMIKDLF